MATSRGGYRVDGIAITTKTSPRACFAIAEGVNRNTEIRAENEVHSRGHTDREAEFPRTNAEVAEVVSGYAVVVKIEEEPRTYRRQRRNGSAVTDREPTPCTEAPTACSWRCAGYQCAQIPTRPEGGYQTMEPVRVGGVPIGKCVTEGYRLTFGVLTTNWRGRCRERVSDVAGLRETAERGEKHRTGQQQ